MDDGLLSEMRAADKLADERAKNPAANWLASVSNFIVFTVFGLGILSALLACGYVALAVLRRFSSGQ